MKSHIEISEMARIALANAKAEAQIDADIKKAVTPLEKFWAGSASSLYIARCKAGAVRKIDLR